MAGLGTLEAQAGNGKGCGKDLVDPVESILSKFSAELTKMAGKFGLEALANVNEVVTAPIPPEQALTFAKAVTAKDMMDALCGGLERQLSPFSPELLVATRRAGKQILTVVYGHYSGKASEQEMTLLAQAIREQFGKIS